jgi:uncharacterized surface protein with fasciclin (FAS1) repeats
MAWRGVLACGVIVVVAGCGGSDERAGNAPTASPATVSGPLCDVLPSGEDPGAPETLIGEPAAVALQWIPVATTFEAAVRASGLADELRHVTVFAPTDDAFTAAFDRRRLDDLLLGKRPRELRELVEAHVVDGELPLAQLREAGEVTTRAGRTLPVAHADGQARLGDRARTVCADYVVAGARIHVIDGVLSLDPTTRG